MCLTVGITIGLYRITWFIPNYLGRCTEQPEKRGLPYAVVCACVEALVRRLEAVSHGAARDCLQGRSRGARAALRGRWLASANHMVPSSRRSSTVRRQRSPLSSPDLYTAARPRLSPPRARVGRFGGYLCSRHGQLREGSGGDGAAGRGRAQSEELAVLLLGPLRVRTAPRVGLDVS